MPSPYEIIISNGTGSTRILNGSYTVAAEVAGYEGGSIAPSTQIVSAGVDTYDFTVAASGTLTLHVTEDGAAGGTAVPGAVFVRCDSSGTAYGAPVTSDATGNAVFPYVPYAASGAPGIYYRQTASAEDHEFDDSLQTIVMTAETETAEIANPLAAQRTIRMTDANYSGLPIESGEVTFTAIV